MQNGNVYVIYCAYAKPPHDKICLCFSATERLFFFINSNPRLPAEAQILIAANEHAALQHDSYLDLSGAKTFLENYIDKAQDRGPLGEPILERVRAALAVGVPTLADRYRDIALANL